MSEYRDAAACWDVLGDIRYQMSNTEELRATQGLQFHLVKHGNLLYCMTKHSFTPSFVVSE